jgi:hypothetical protein
MAAAIASVAPDVTITSAGEIKALVAVIVIGDGLSERGNAGHRRVLIGSFRQRPGGGLDHVERAVGVRKTLAEIDRPRFSRAHRHTLEHGRGHGGIERDHGRNLAACRPRQKKGGPAARTRLVIRLKA